MIGCAGEAVLAKFAEVYLKNRTQKSPKTQLYQGFASLQGVVPVAGVEPARVISPTDFESASSANSNTPASHILSHLPMSCPRNWRDIVEGH